MPVGATGHRVARHSNRFTRSWIRRPAKPSRPSSRGRRGLAGPCYRIYRFKIIPRTLMEACQWKERGRLSLLGWNVIHVGRGNWRHSQPGYGACLGGPPFGLSLVGANSVRANAPDTQGGASLLALAAAQAGVVIDAALKAEPVAFVMNQISTAFETCSQSEDFQADSHCWSSIKLGVGRWL